MTYLWIKVVHVLAIISWMAGMLYLPRLFVYHAGKTVGSEADETFRVMERRLLKAIMTPAMLVAVATGLYMLHDGGFALTSTWVLLKLAAVVGLLAVHGLLARQVKVFARGENTRPGRYFRILNEVPTALMIVIVIAVIIKPGA